MSPRTGAVWRARQLSAGAVASAVSATVAPAIPPARTFALFSRLFASPAPAVPSSAPGPAASSFWLDSADPHPRLGRLSVLGDTAGPLGAVHEFRVSAAATAPGSGNVWARLRALLSASHRPLISDGGGSAPTLPSGVEPDLILALGYELGAPESAADGDREIPGVPDAVAFVPSRLVVVDHYTGEAVALCAAYADGDGGASASELAASAWLDQAEQVWAESATDVEGAEGMGRAADRGTRSAASSPALASGGAFRLRQPQEEYLRSIALIKGAIASGEAYEVCLTNAATGPAPTDALEAYGRLRRHSPAPFAAFLRAGGGAGWALLGASPERFLRIGAGGEVETRPIKGTRPRGAGAEADAALRAELAGNAKDRAENLMIVDLLRNDLGRVCAPGTIRVPQLCAVETYAHVHQLVSAVEGRLAPGRDAVDALAATFPGGSMTGAPKRRAMDLCAGLEGRPRGLYAGAVGWLGASGTADLAITIRSAVVAGGLASVGIGGAILADSDPAAEFAETMVKLRPLLDALGAELEG